MQTNPMQLSEDLKGVPLHSLMQYAQGANPMVPQWMALTEMARRKSIQQAGQPQAPQGPQPTVKDQLVQQTGLEALQRQRQMAMQQLLNGGGGPGMAAGGLVSFQAGGAPYVPKYPTERSALQDTLDIQGGGLMTEEQLRRAIAELDRELAEMRLVTPAQQTGRADIEKHRAQLVQALEAKRGPIIGSQQAAQIPGYSGPVPAAQPPGLAERLQRDFGVPAGLTRNITNTLNAIPGISGLLTGVSSGAGALSQAGRMPSAASAVQAALSAASPAVSAGMGAARSEAPPPAAPKPPAAAPAPVATPGWEVVDKRPDAAPAPTEDAGIAALTNLPALTPDQYMTPEERALMERKPTSLEDRLKDYEARRPKNQLGPVYDEMLAEMRKRRGEATQGQGLEDLIRVLSGAKQGRGGMGKAYTEMQEGRRSAADKLREQEMALRLKQVEAQQAYENGDFERYTKLREEVEKEGYNLALKKADVSGTAYRAADQQRTSRLNTQENARMRELTARLAAEQRREAATASVGQRREAALAANQAKLSGNALFLAAQAKYLNATDPAKKAAAWKEMQELAATMGVNLQSPASGAARDFEVLPPRNP